MLSGRFSVCSGLLVSFFKIEEKMLKLIFNYFQGFLRSPYVVRRLVKEERVWNFENDSKPVGAQGSKIIILQQEISRILLIEIFFWKNGVHFINRLAQNFSEVTTKALDCFIDVEGNRREFTTWKISSNWKIKKNNLIFYF